MSHDEFISEPIFPVLATCDAARIASGEPGLPRQFVWRGETVEVATLVRSWRETGDCRHGSGERYVRKHWYEVETDAGQSMKIYFERHPRGGDKHVRWWLYSVGAAQPAEAQR